MGPHNEDRLLEGTSKLNRTGIMKTKERNGPNEIVMWKTDRRAQQVRHTRHELQDTT